MLIDTVISNSLTANHCAVQLTLFPEDSHVNLIPLPASEEAQKMTVLSGQRCSELSRKSSQLGSLVKMLLESSTWNSTRCYLTWKESGTPARRLLFRLVRSMPRTSETGCGLLPTPRAAMTGGISVIRQADKNPNLETVLSRVLLPTPTAQDGKNNTFPASQKNRDTVPGWILSNKLLPTPIASDCGEKLTGKENQDSLTKLSRGITGQTGRLNHRFVLEMMGYPPNWCDLQSKQPATQ